MNGNRGSVVATRASERQIKIIKKIIKTQRNDKKNKQKQDRDREMRID